MVRWTIWSDERRELERAARTHTGFGIGILALENARGIYASLGFGGKCEMGVINVNRPTGFTEMVGTG